MKTIAKKKKLPVAIKEKRIKNKEIPPRVVLRNTADLLTGQYAL